MIIEQEYAPQGEAARAYREALQRGYLVHRRGCDDNVLKAWFRRCREEGMPFVAVERGPRSRYSDIYINLLLPRGAQLDIDGWERLVGLALRLFQSRRTRRGSHVYFWWAHASLILEGIPNKHAAEITEVLLDEAKRVRQDWLQREYYYWL